PADRPRKSAVLCLVRHRPVHARASTRRGVLRNSILANDPAQQCTSLRALEDLRAKRRSVQNELLNTHHGTPSAESRSFTTRPPTDDDRQSAGVDSTSYSTPRTRTRSDAMMSGQAFSQYSDGSTTIGA